MIFFVWHFRRSKPFVVLFTPPYSALSVKHIHFFMKEEIKISPRFREKITNLPFIAWKLNFGQIVELNQLALEEIILASTDAQHVILYEVILRSIDIISLIYIISACFLDYLEIVYIDVAVIGFFSKNTNQVVETVSHDFEVCEIRAGKSYLVIDHLEKLELRWNVFV